MDFYERLGVRKRINGAGLLTRLGGSLMSPEALEAMLEAAQSFVDIAELQAAASEVIARSTGAEAGLVSSGAAAALTLGTAACLTGFDVPRMERLPDTEGMPNEVVMCRTHRTAYDHAIRAAGARIREVGFNDRAAGAGVRGIEPWEIEAAIGPATVAVAYAANPADQPPLREVVAVADRHGLPVLVDAAAQLPPVENLRRFIGEGAALVAFSGGKSMRGPQSTGVLCGRRDLVAAALLQQIDMDVAPETWQPPALIPRERLNGVPHHGVGRGYKVGKEEIAGLIAALERYVARDGRAEVQEKSEQLQAIADRLEGLDGLALRRLSARDTGRYPMLELALDADALGCDAYAFSRRLTEGEPPVHLSERRAAEGILTIDPAGLRQGDEAVVAERVRQALQQRPAARSARA